jgi:hypothetical protein
MIAEVSDEDRNILNSSPGALFGTIEEGSQD